MSTEPYGSNHEYLEAELTQYLPLRAARINAERQTKDAKQYIPSDTTVGERQQVTRQESERKGHELRLQEQQMREAIEARLALTRKTEGQVNIGLDHLGDLDAESRLMLLVLTAPALGMANEVFGELGTAAYYGGGINVSDLMVVLDARTIVARLRVRQLLLKMSSQGFVILDYRCRQTSPEDFNSVSVSLTWRAFSVILNDPALEHEGTTATDSE